MRSAITCDTDISSIISRDDIIPFLDEIEEESFVYKGKMDKSLVVEMDGGGLSREGLTINDTSPLEDRAREILDRDNLSSALFNFRDYVLELCDSQRSLELSTLDTKLSEKLKDLTAEYNSIKSEYVYWASDEKNRDIANRLGEVEDEISFYTEKQNVVEGLMNE